ncbi:nucleotidyltransferase domain-containing protein [Clostridium vincentii]|uniref:Nucleotidyltransferase domain protein n=1 Tax=Clostridium vincentii TaxID=52704 RepID=A0A2T0BJ11_9CLOT|nr:nucleotidyltransferase domain-containing protein [Clostridium vincentii]PRR83879.1 Nucleotidyltransferase domain protein [Clostridium vincentii]
MAKTVAQLQNAFQSVVNTLKKNKKVLAIFTFGSIISGDVWEDSDIDLFVVYETGFPKIRDVHSEVLGIPVHTKLLHKEVFFKLYEKEGKRGLIRNLLLTSKLVFNKDNDIVKVYDKVRYSIDIHSERLKLVYLGEFLKDSYVCKKYLETGGISTSYEVLIRTLDSFSKLLIVLMGYQVSKDSLNMASNIDNRFKVIVEELFLKSPSRKTIQNTIEYIDKFLDENIILSSKFLLDYLSKENEFLSAYEIKDNEDFREFNIEIENILKELLKRKVVTKNKRILRDSEGNKILEENVYIYKTI